MLFKKSNYKIIILGINELSLYFADRHSNDYDIVIIGKEESSEQHEIDAIITTINEDLSKTLNDYNIEKTNLFLALTENEEYNLFATRLASEYGAKKTIAMVKNPNYINLSSASHIFNPYQLVNDKTNSIFKETKFKNIKNIISGKVNITEYSVINNDFFVHKNIKDLNKDDRLILSIKRKNRIIIPYDNLKLIPNDIIYILYKKDMFTSVFKQLSKKGKINKKVFIIGGNELGFFQALKWKNIFDSIIIIESNLNKCHKLAEKCNDILVLHGEGTEKNLLLDEGLNNDSIILAFDTNDFHNLLSSYLAKKHSCNNIVTLLNNNKHTKISELLGLKTIISLPQLITEHLNLYIKTGHLLNKYFLGDEIYATKVKIKEGSSLKNKKIKDFKYKKIIIGVIIRNNKVIIPSGKELIYQDDELLIFFNKNVESSIYNIFN